MDPITVRDAGAAPQAPTPVSPAVRWPAHVLLGAWVAAFLLLGTQTPLAYDRLLQEDRFVEWWTVALFGAAAWFALRLAWRQRRAFDGLVGLFCVFVAGEEFSWGQRLLGLTPPDVFLEHNRQQELTVHNFADVFGQPKTVLILALIGFGLLLPVAARSAPGRGLLHRLGASAPPVSLAPWFALAVALLVWYPLGFTGEWVETLAGGLFLLTFVPAARVGLIAAGTGIGLAAVLTLVSGTRAATPAELACAEAEARAIAEDLAYGAAATGRLAGARSVHKRVYTAVQEGYVRADALETLRAVSCPGDGDAAERRAHAIDPWSTAYWLDLDRMDEGIRLIVYSFGPNRRRDGTGAASDDIVARVMIRL